MKLAISMIVTLISVVLVLLIVAAFFLIGIQHSPIEAQRTFAEGCARYCADILKDSQDTNKPIGVAAVEKGHALEGSDFIAACNRLYPETSGYPYLCWLNNCCYFELPKP